MIGYFYFNVADLWKLLNQKILKNFTLSRIAQRFHAWSLISLSKMRLFREFLCVLHCLSRSKCFHKIYEANQWFEKPWSLRISRNNKFHQNLILNSSRFILRWILRFLSHSHCYSARYHSADKGRLVIKTCSLKYRDNFFTRWSSTQLTYSWQLLLSHVALCDSDGKPITETHHRQSQSSRQVDSIKLIKLTRTFLTFSNEFR